MALATAAMKNILALAYSNQTVTAGAAFASLFTSTGPYGSAGTEPSGGSPAYARKALTWGAPSNGVSTATVTFDVPTGVTINGAGVHTLATGGVYLDGGSVTAQAFASQGTYQLTLTVTVT